MWGWYGWRWVVIFLDIEKHDWWREQYTENHVLIHHTIRPTFHWTTCACPPTQRASHDSTTVRTVWHKMFRIVDSRQHIHMSWRTQKPCRLSIPPQKTCGKILYPHICEIHERATKHLAWLYQLDRWFRKEYNDFILSHEHCTAHSAHTATIHSSTYWTITSWHPVIRTSAECVTLEIAWN